jgi:YHS domain-containing protein
VTNEKFFVLWKEQKVLRCPVTGKLVELHVATPTVDLQHGQKVYFCAPECTTSFSKDMISFFRNPKHLEATREFSSATLVNAKNCDGESLVCPCCQSLFLVNQQTPRVFLKFGQVIFFDSFACLGLFVRRPNKYCVDKSGKSKLIRASCLTDHEEVIANSSCPTVYLRGGQRIFCCSKMCVDGVASSPISFTVAMHEIYPAVPNAVK